MKVFIGSDHAGLPLKHYLIYFIERFLGYDLEDVGAYDAKPVDYPDIALDVMKKVLKHEGSMGLLICATGQGMNMAANCYKGIRTALCHDVYLARRSREHNNANILALGREIAVDYGMVRDIVRIFLTTPFSNEERHVRRIKKMERPKKKLEL